MDRRLKLQDELEQVLGSKNVYFNPPESLKLKYPCIVYHLDNGDTIYADDMPYLFSKRYQLTLIARDPDCELVDKLAYKFQTIRMDRPYTSDNLYHWSYALYY